MRRRTMLMLAMLVAVASVASTGCVSKKMFRKNVEANDTRVAAVESGVEANERRIKDLSEETDSKIAELDAKTERATEVGQSAMTVAEKAVRGRLIWEVTLNNDQVKFSFNQADVPQEAARVLDDLVGKIMSYDKAVYVEVEGHTDATGTDAYNYDLGYKRAMTVRDYMAKNGVPLHAINVISLGEEKPVANNDSTEGRAQNRRVVIRVLE
ncbi:MAG TPA: OmpA family protein [Candidatus Polarisedimenticolaceae bacterium]|nr:OmpA family protein [Candidatus Polarisedimenticolaceae bacterium]